MDKKRQNLLEMRKLGFSTETISLLSESQIAVILEKIKKNKKETKEAEQTTKKITKLQPTDSLPPNTTLQQAMAMGKKPDGITKTVDTKKINPSKDTTSVDDIADKTELGENKNKKSKKYNPWAVCTASVGRKNKKKYEDCVMGVKKKLKEGKDPYEYIIESRIEEIVENNLSPKMTKSDILRIIVEKKKMMKKPIGRGTVLGGEMSENTETAPVKAPPKTSPGERPSHPGRKQKDQPNPKPKASSSEMEAKKSEIITAIFNLIDKENK
ncbi:hypothetical protein EBU94_02945 [bacterium]|nr:hypothetical protein [bacterium]